jgi:hypothetical protein
MNDANRSPKDNAMPLSALLRDAAQELRHLQPPAELHERIAARWRASAMPRRVGWRMPRAIAWSGAAACALAFAVSLLLLTLPPGPRPDALAPSASGFMPLVGPERWRQLTADSATPAWVVTTEVPRERLAAIGMPFDPARAAEPVRAELLMHASGDVIALRVIGQ